MTHDEIRSACHVVADVLPDAMVVASPPTWNAGGHVTVVHHPDQADVVDEALGRAGLRSQRVNVTRTKVLGYEARR